jgi:hypothetical protein
MLTHKIAANVTFCTPLLASIDVTICIKSLHKSTVLQVRNVVVVSAELALLDQCREVSLLTVGVC